MPISENSTSYAIIGGAGFIGSHFVDELLANPKTSKLVVFDNFSSGRNWHIADHLGDSRLEVIRGDVTDLALLTSSIRGCQKLIHLASNPDIAAAAVNPAIDFDSGTCLTHFVLEAARKAGIQQILYASGSGVYGEAGENESNEDAGPLVPVSTYAASKIAGEAMLSSYAHMFGMQCISFRFGNVVGFRQTHGVGYDFLRKLRIDPTRLEILGDGSQSKSYVYVRDVINAVLLASEVVTDSYDVFNVATLDYITVSEIARLAVQVAGFNQEKTKLYFSGGDRGWKGDVPIVRLSSKKIRAIGWANKLSCVEAVTCSLMEMHQDPRSFVN